MSREHSTSYVKCRCMLIFVFCVRVIHFSVYGIAISSSSVFVIYIISHNFRRSQKQFLRILLLWGRKGSWHRLNRFVKFCKIRLYGCNSVDPDPENFNV